MAVILPVLFFSLAVVARVILTWRLSVKELRERTPEPAVPESREVAEHREHMSERRAFPVVRAI